MLFQGCKDASEERAEREGPRGKQTRPLLGLEESGMRRSQRIADRGNRRARGQPGWQGGRGTACACLCCRKGGLGHGWRHCWT